MRQDARRNSEKLAAAALEVFAEQGLDAPLGEIAARAGVRPGTIYNRFGGRSALIDSVMPSILAERIQGFVRDAEATDDPWEAFAGYVTSVCAMQATDSALNDAVSRRITDAEQLTAICDAQLEWIRPLVERARQAGVLRPDFATEDLSFLFWSTANVVRATARTAPDAWRRSLALTLDGLRTGPPRPLPVGPLTPAQVHESMLSLSERHKSGS